MLPGKWDKEGKGDKIRSQRVLSGREEGDLISELEGDVWEPSFGARGAAVNSFSLSVCLGPP